MSGLKLQWHYYTTFRLKDPQRPLWSNLISIECVVYIAIPTSVSILKFLNLLRCRLFSVRFLIKLTLSAENVQTKYLPGQHWHLHMNPQAKLNWTLKQGGSIYILFIIYYSPIKFAPGADFMTKDVYYNNN